jgi:hypothetical protein
VAETGDGQSPAVVVELKDGSDGGIDAIRIG